jgi:hypothetical protein
MKLSSVNIYIAELALMPYIWFLKQFFLKILLLRTISFFKNKKLNLFLNFLFFPILLIFSPVLSYFKMQYYEDIITTTNKKNILLYGKTQIKTYRTDHNGLDFKTISKKMFS